eukprot:767719-Hanusia_phi.AAC.2
MPSPSSPGNVVSSSTSLIGGCVSGVITTVATQPLDVIRTEMQKTPTKQRLNTWTACCNVVHRHGWKGLWNGMVPSGDCEDSVSSCVFPLLLLCLSETSSVLRVGTGMGIYFFCLNHLHVPVVMQSNGGVKPQNSFTVCVSLTARAPQAHLLSRSSPSGLLLGGWQQLSSCRSPSSRPGEPDSVLTCCCTSSCDSAEKKLMGMVSFEAGDRWYGNGILQTLRGIAQAEHPSALFRGFLPTLLRDSPFSGVYLLLYSKSKAAIEPLDFAHRVPRPALNFCIGAFSGPQLRIPPSHLIPPICLLACRSFCHNLDQSPRRRPYKNAAAKH